MKGCWMAELESQLDPGSSFLAFKIKEGSASRAPRFHKFFEGGKHKSFFSVAKIHRDYVAVLTLGKMVGSELKIT